MKYAALFRGVNVGGKNRVEMKKLRSLLESAGYTDVSTYLNSGNIIFASEKNSDSISLDLYRILQVEFGLDIPILIKTEEDLKTICDAIPRKWQNDKEQRSDVAYLFPEIDSARIIEELPLRQDFMEIRYVSGALIWNMDRGNYNKSHLSKLAGHKLYRLMTIRNVNTARYLGGL